jgi:hypothetical protein
MQNIWNSSPTTNSTRHTCNSTDNVRRAYKTNSTQINNGSFSQKFPLIVEPDGSLPRSQEPATEPYPESWFFKIHFNIILSTPPRFQE